MEQDTGQTEVLATPTLHRCKVACAPIGHSIESLARAAQVSTRHLWHVLQGERVPSQDLLRRLRAVLGAESWAYATGQTDYLPCPPLAQRAA
jgi:transcriptional regulator with XRE-family HTH domain